MSHQLISAAALSTLFVSAAASAAEPSGLARLPSPGMEFAFRVEAAVSPPQEVGVVDGGRRRIIPILGGIVRGPKIQAEILPGGADWQVLRDESNTSVLARYTLRTNDGHLISVVNTGIRRGTPEVLKRLAGPDFVDPSTYYFRSTPTFEVADGHYAWLRESVFVCTGAREAARVILDCYALR
ncbi:MAG: hypothetical protein RLZZ200_1169 [Pseudomonadota bacterium]|jgi:hypothetical protein